ncbi:MAG: hypothetical protein US50_C0070G0007, partial [Candidatus Nomurabacteria bacterium GW2011_GWB1_37_5]
ISLGVDIVDISELQKKIDASSLFLQKILTNRENDNFQLESIAGKIAAKEAIIKTGYIKPGEWKNIMISINAAGAPIVLDRSGAQINKIKITISHTTKLAVAVALYEKD